MKKLYNEYFHIPKYGKIRDKVMLIRTAVTTVIMIACLAAMSFSAYAYFSCTISSGSNNIQSANFEAKVSISIIEKDSSKPVDVVKVENDTQEAKLKAGAEYTVTLTPGDSTAKTGFCVITAENCTATYHTQQIGVDQSVEGGKTPSITFKLTVSNDTTVVLLSHWGTSSCYEAYKDNTEDVELYICNGDTVHMTVVAATASTDTAEKSTTASAATTTTVVTTQTVADGTTTQETAVTTAQMTTTTATSAETTASTAAVQTTEPSQTATASPQVNSTVTTQSGE